MKKEINKTYIRFEPNEILFRNILEWMIDIVTTQKRENFDVPFQFPTFPPS